MQRSMLILAVCIVVSGISVSVSTAQDEKPRECCCTIDCHYKKPLGDNATLPYTECFGEGEALLPLEFMCDEELVCQNLKVQKGKLLWQYLGYSGGCVIPCSSAHLLGSEDPRLEVLRRFRDEVLSTSAAGQKIITLYYGYSNDLIEIFEANPRLKLHARQLLESIIPAIEALMGGKATSLALNDASIANGEMIIEEIDAVVTTPLQDELANLRKQMQQEGLLSQ